MSGLQVSTQVTIGDRLTFLGLVGGFVSLLVVAFQVSASSRQARGRFVVDVINRYFDDRAMLGLHYQIDSKTYTFNPESPESWRETTEAISRTLNHLDSVGFLVDKKIISLEDVAILKHRIIRFFGDTQVNEALKVMNGQDGVKGAHGPAVKLKEQLGKS
jgi:hypothetical protein